MKTLFRKLILAVLIAVLTVAGLPLTSVLAAAPQDTGTPPKDPAAQNARLALAYARERLLVEQIGLTVGNYPTMTQNIQTLIEKAKENGKDVAAVQAAFEAYKAAFEKAKPSYEQAKALVSAQAGFDANGQVTDAEKAKATLKSLSEALKKYKATLGGTPKALREAIQAFRAANPRTPQTPTP